MTRTLLTGVAGFTGRYVAAMLSEQGHQVHGIVHLQDQDSIKGVERLYEVDLADGLSVGQVVADVQPDYVIHLAGIAFVAHSNIAEIYRSNLLGTRQLLDALASLRQPPRSVLIASSANVYGNVGGGEIDENTPFNPTNDYAVSKVAMEFAASLYRPRLPLTIVRPFNYTGRGQSPRFIIPKIVAHARDGALTIELGNLGVARDFSDVRTVAHVYTQLIQTPTAVGETYNVCSGEAVTLEEVLETVWRLSGRKFDVLVNPALVRANEVRVLKGSKAKLESAIGPLPSIPLEETLQWMLAS